MNPGIPRYLQYETELQAYGLEEDFEIPMPPSTYTRTYWQRNTKIIESTEMNITLVWKQAAENQPGSPFHVFKITKNVITPVNSNGKIIGPIVTNTREEQLVKVLESEVWSQRLFDSYLGEFRNAMERHVISKEGSAAG